MICYDLVLFVFKTVLNTKSLSRKLLHFHTTGKLCDIVGIRNNKYGALVQYSIGNGERYHGPLRTIFKKISHEKIYLDMEYEPHLAVKSMNHTMGPDGLVP